MKILNFGSCNIDYVYSLDHIALPGETETVDKLKIFPGGKGLNQSIAISRAGQSVFHAGCVGTDGTFLVSLLEENRVDTSFIRTFDKKTGQAIIQVSKQGDNSILVYPGTNNRVSKEHIDSVLENFSAGDIILLQNEINNLDYVVEKAYEKRMRIVLNPSPYNEMVGSIDFNKISYLVINEIEAKSITGCDDPDHIIEYFKNNYKNLCVMLTLGSKGCIYSDGKEKIYHPIFKVDAVDTTAAGDTFTGYFVAGLVEGRRVYDILRFASCASAIAVSKMGAAVSIPLASEVESQLQQLRTDEGRNKKEILRRKIESYVSLNLADATLEGLAAEVGYSPVYMGVLVKQIYGDSFKKLLHEKRLGVASKMLLETEVSVGEVIKTVGYENESFFRKIFKEKYGQNPLNYKKYMSR